MNKDNEKIKIKSRLAAALCVMLACLVLAQYTGSAALAAGNISNGKNEEEAARKSEGKRLSGIVTLGDYDSVGSFHEGIAAVSKDGKWGYIDKTGKEIVKPKYDNTYRTDADDDFIFSEGLAKVEMGKIWPDYKYGYIDKKGREIVKLKYSYARNFSEGLAAVGIDTDSDNGDYADKFGYINKKGREVTKLKYDKASDFSEGLACVEKDGKYGYIDKKGREIVKPKYDWAGSFSEGLAVVKKNGKCGYINKKGKVVMMTK